MEFYFVFSVGTLNRTPYTLFPIGTIICSLVCREPAAPNRTPSQFSGDINDD